MRIVAVQAKNFRSYAELSWSLPEAGLYLIDGRNLDTGRSNMVGKTTLIDSITYALYGYLPKWGGPKGGPADAVIRRGQGSCRVEVLVVHAGKTIRIVRERPAKLAVFVNSEKLEGKISDLDARIPELVGMSAAQYLLSVYIAQDRTSSFFSMSDTERTKILSVISGLEELNCALEKAKQLKSDLQSRSERMSGAIGALESQLARIPPERDALILRQAGADRSHQELLGELERISANATELVEACRQGLTEEIQALEEATKAKLDEQAAKEEDLAATRSRLEASLSGAPEVEPELLADLSQAQASLSAARSGESERRNIESKNQMVLEQMDRKLKELQRINDPTHQNCPTCLQAIPEERLEAAAKKVFDELKAMEARILPLPEPVDVGGLERAYQEASSRVAQRRAELASGPNAIRSEIKAIDAELSSIHASKRSVLQELEYQKRILEQDFRANVARAESELNAIESKISSADLERKAFSRDLERLRQSEDALLSELVEHKANVALLNRELDEVLDLIDLFGPKGFRAVCFEGLISRISDRAGELFSLMTDGVYSTRIEQIGETAKGEERVVLRPVITKGGIEVPQDDLSGGARRMVMLSYDIAVAEAVGESSALFLDEALDGLDAIGKAEAVRALEAVAAQRAVFLIDHTSEIKSSVQDVLLIEQSGGESRLSGNVELEPSAQLN